MKAFHIHIEGQVQGVGFRPYVYRLATEMGLFGWVSNGTDGVHIEVEGDDRNARMFGLAVVRNAPTQAHITRHGIFEITLKSFQQFSIEESTHTRETNLLITPDLGICPKCQQELADSTNKRFGYAFATCTECGPRYSIIEDLPYDRINTTMNSFEMCPDCKNEYNTITDRRFFSQTNSCPTCGVSLSLCRANGEVMANETQTVLQQAIQFLNDGKILAVKNIGGYLLMCDARNETAIERLRIRKHRPAKPFALLFSSVEQIKKYAHVSEAEKDSLTSVQAPIVLVKKRFESDALASNIAPHLNELGVMLPASPLLSLIAAAYPTPLIATSGNISGSPIFFEDEKAFENLKEIADYFITNNRNILVPQDDSVVRFTDTDLRVMIRRSRGFAPTLLQHPRLQVPENTLALGGDLKSAFAFTHRQNIYVSQYLGDLENFETQQCFENTCQHIQTLLHAAPRQIVIDRHPNYFSHNLGKKWAVEHEIDLTAIQHHQAHFASVLAESDLLESQERVLGVIWDGTGWGEDGNSWGGEFFTFEKGEFDRVAHLDYFPNLLGDKMSKEPRLAALSLCRNCPEANSLLQSKFKPAEWNLYNQMLLQPTVFTSSVGRLFDGIASLLGLCDRASYEGEAALYLEALAARANQEHVLPRARWLSAKEFSLQTTVAQLVNDIHSGVPKETIAFNFHKSLVNWIAQVALRQNAKRIAFSGGVFQNTLLLQLIQEQLGDRYELYFHQQLSPNDECLALGQLACLHLQQLANQRNKSAYSLYLN